MPQPLRLFVDSPLAEGRRITLSAAQAHYLGTVMRRRMGDPVVLFNGRDGEWLGRIAALNRGQATAAIEGRLRPQADEPDIWLAFALLKRDATDLVVQKATELGASAILPIMTERTQAARVNEARLAAIAAEAAEQSERLTVPRLHAPVTLSCLLDNWPPGRPLFVALERSGASPLRPQAGPVGLLVGPEGGFAQAELDLLSQCSIVIPISLGPRILRAETACLAGLALLQVPGCG